MSLSAPETAVDEGPRSATRPRRRCFVTRRVVDKDALVRFVVGPDHTVVPDTTETLPGRGLWLSAERDVVNTACARNAFAKGFRAKVAVEPDLADHVERLLARRCLDLLGLARRAGAAAAGFEKVRALLGSGAAGVLVTASDAAADGRQRLGRAAAGVPMVTAFCAAELAAAIGREHVVYLAVRKGRMAQRIAAEAARLAGFRRVGEARGAKDRRRATG
jgi:hypothetical protein